MAERLRELLGCPVALAPDSVGPAVEALTRNLADGEVLLLENLRFHPGEERNDPAHAAALAALADVYINDAFGTAHRAHASTVGVAELLPAAAGPLMHAEIQALDRATRNPARPYVAVLGGAKVSDKIGVLRRLAEDVDALLLGGGIANTFLANAGGALGRSLVEPGQAEVVAAVRAAAAVLRLPHPAAGRRGGGRGGRSRRRHVHRSSGSGSRRPDGSGHRSRRHGRLSGRAGRRPAPWSGTGRWASMNMHRLPRARWPSHADWPIPPAFVVVAGGDALAAAQAAGVADRMGHLSTGGGATLEFLEGRELPGLAALPDA